MPGCSAAQASAFCPQADGDAILTQLFRDHFSTDRNTGASPVCNYHTLLRAFLLEQGHVLLGPPTPT